MSAGCASTFATFSMLCEKLIIHGALLLEQEVHQRLGGRQPRLARDLGEAQAFQLVPAAGGDEDLVESYPPLRDRAPALAVDQALLDDAPPRRTVGEPLEQLRRAPIVGPGRHHVVELRAAGVVRIDVA